MKLIQKYGKKKVYIGSTILIVVCIVIGIGTWYIMEQNYKQKVLDSIGIAFVDDASIEYGTEQVDFNSFIKDRIGEPEIQLPFEEMNTKELGKKQVTYVLSKDGYSKDVNLEVEIKDTQFPVIELNEESISLEINEEFDVKSNIKAIKDVVDGDIAYTEDETITKDGYIINSNVDTSEVGDYNVKLVAFDKNGNKMEKEYAVDVVEKEKINEPFPDVPSGTSGKPNSTPTTNGYSDGSNGSNSTAINPVICPNGEEPFDKNLACDSMLPGIWNQANPKILFEDYDSAYNYGDNLMMNDNEYSSEFNIFTVAPCYRNDHTGYYVITPRKK